MFCKVGGKGREVLCGDYGHKGCEVVVVRGRGGEEGEEEEREREEEREEGVDEDRGYN